MAPIRPTAKSKRISNLITTKQASGYQSKPSSSVFTSTKRDKQLIKKSVFKSKVSQAGIKKNKRRRPSKKLVTNLESLEDALQDVARSEGEQQALNLRTIKGGRGEGKRREKIVMEERERFGKNLAILSQAGNAGSGEGKASKSQWETLQAHIQASMAQSTKEGG